MVNQKLKEGEVLNRWLREQGMSAIGLSNMLGVTRSNVYYHLKQDKIADEFKNRLVKAGYTIPGLNVRSLNIDTVHGQVNKSNARAINLTEDQIMHVPLVNKHAQAGYTQGYGDHEYIETLPTIPFPVDRQYKGTYRAFEVSGDSMDIDARRYYKAGDIVLGREIGQQQWGDKLHINRYSFVIVHKTEGILIKEIARHDVSTGIITLHSLNEFYDDYDVSLDDVAQIYNVVKVVRDE
jgi:phage repressor protein C with HTH and peptisase S24 domain